MFKLESYITPIILSYVDKYIKNFRPQDSQVSLWGGDASFHNLDLRLEVLEQELQLPFSFVSGHIHELLIHVPWTKLAAEPITITINTIECILKLPGGDDGQNAESAAQVRERTKRVQQKRQQIETPTGYLQLLINKIVSNIRIYCNNLILKYVEEDIVLSMNVKLLTFESANEKWEPAYTDVSPSQMLLRKLIAINDLTVCLDKRNASGKIDVYQEPMLYRCSMIVHLLRCDIAGNKRSFTTRLDVFCNSMEFSMTEQQIPMLLRLIHLLQALHQKQFKTDVEGNFETDALLDTNEYGLERQTLAGWAWSFVPSILPIHEDEIDAQYLHNLGPTTHIGFYVDNASLTFKVSESSNEKGPYYSQKKIKYWPLMTLKLQGIFMDSIFHGKQWSQVSMGISELVLIPIGQCSCSIQDVVETSTSQIEYLKAGNSSSIHKSDSLFDAEAPENKGKRKLYNTNWDFHIEKYNEAALLERSPAFAIDYLYQLIVPDDMSSENLSELGSDLEYSNLSERALLRIVVGPFKLRLCSGLVHRFSSLQAAASAYDYSPYSVLKPDPELQELPPASEDDFDALNENIPMRVVQFTILDPVIELQLMDHSYFEATKGELFRKRKKVSTHSQVPASSNLELPKITLECQCIDMKISYPMYVKRLVQTTCQLPDPPKHMFEACHTTRSIKVIGLFSRLVIGGKSLTILSPSNGSFIRKEILTPQYWIDSNVVHDSMDLECESITIAGTYPKMIVYHTIVDKFLKRDVEDAASFMQSSSLLADATKSQGLVYLEFYVESMKLLKVKTCTTITATVSLGSIKTFIMEPVLADCLKSSDHSLKGSYFPTCEIQQVLIFSGPESDTRNLSETQQNDNENEEPLLKAVVQFPLNPEEQAHAPLVFFSLREIKVCIDPLLCKWLVYKPKMTGSKMEVLYESAQRKLSRSFSENSAYETPRRSRTPYESVHSSLEQATYTTQTPKEPTSQPKCPESECETDFQEVTYDFLKKWFEVWKGMLLYGDIAHCTIYFPVQSLSAVDSQGILQAIERAMKKENPPDTLVLTLPSVSVRNAIYKDNVQKYCESIPVQIPDNIWTKNKSSFPWNFQVSSFSCVTWQNSSKRNCLAPTSLTSTVGMSTNTGNKAEERSGSEDYKSIENIISIGFSGNKNDISTFGVCVHIDMTPILISISEAQLCLIASIVHGLIEVLFSILPEPKQETYKVAEAGPQISTSGPRGSNVSSTIHKESVDSTSEKLPSVLSEVVEAEGIKLMAWIQWTISRFSLELLAYDKSDKSESDTDCARSSVPNLKFVVDAEDIVSSLDFQNVYLKLKSKIGSASIMHYVMDAGNAWIPGDFLGFVLRANEGSLQSHCQEDISFASVTITRASCQHTHSLWGTKKNKKSLEKENVDNANAETRKSSRYITEIVLSLQPIDILLSPITLKNYFLVLEPLLQIPSRHGYKNRSGSSSRVQISNRTLPLTFVELNGFRVIMPSTDLEKSNQSHNTCVLQIKRINLSPTAENPICRTPSRPDIYQQAAQSRILHVPGSDIEDRQYQLDIRGICMNSGSWTEISQVLRNYDKSASFLKTMSENPALEWNRLEKGKLPSCPDVTYWPIISKFDISVVFAPAMIYKSDVICGHSVEVNFISDINFTVSLEQIKMAWSLMDEARYAFDAVTYSKLLRKGSSMIFPYASLLKDDDSNAEAETAVDVMRDSGIETSDLRSTTYSLKTKESARKMSDVSEKSGFLGSTPHFVKSSFGAINTNYIPLDILVTGGQISLVLYEFEKLQKGESKIYDGESDKGYEASEESSVDEKSNQKQFTALLFFSISQPNAFLSDALIGKKVQVSCYDVSVKINGPQRKVLKGIPSKEDFAVNLVKTKLGKPNEDTGVLPAFFTVRWTKSIGKQATLDLEVAKPTKMVFSMCRLIQLKTIRKKLLQSFSGDKTVEAEESNNFDADILSNKAFTKVHPKCSDHYVKFELIKEKFMGVSVININIDQVVVALQSSIGVEVTLAFSKLNNQLTVNSRPEKLLNVINIDCLTLGTMINETTSQLVLNPWSLSVEVLLYWESWQHSNANPQVQITSESDAIIFDISPDRILYLQTVFSEIQKLIESSNGSSFPAKTKHSEPMKSVPSGEREQHYKDDLRAGAFHFVDSTSGNIDELPLPYQVVFWNRNISAMAWRYPQPRALTKVRIFPVPFKISSGNEEDQQILCHLEFWSDCHNCYQPYTQFYLSETEMLHLELPKSHPQSAVACTWRVVLTTPSARDYNQSRVLISPRALAGCIRVDSYFNKSLIPQLTLAVHVSSINVNLLNYFNRHLKMNMPDALKNFTSDLFIPEYQQFLTVTIDNAKAYLATWKFQTAIFDVNCTAKCTVLDYAFLTQHLLVEPFYSKVEVSLSKSTSINFAAQPIHVNFGASVAHTMAISMQMWNEIFKLPALELTMLTEDVWIDFIPMTRYIICNDTNINLRFGQAGFQDILLPSRYFHMYSWRSQKTKQLIRVALEDKYVWSEPFRIDIDGIEMYKIMDDNAMIVVTVKSLSATQKQVILSGQFIICNTLLEHFEMKIFRASSKDKENELKIAPSNVIRGKSTPPSMLIDNDKNYYLRIRFYRLESAWSGDIPLMENTKCAQPWLVKVPLQERGQFLSVWCRIVVQKFPKGRLILAMLWPLFMIRSNLPISAKVNIETPTLNVNLDCTVRGFGEYQQLYCPGTIDHSHQLTFHLDSCTSNSNPYVPLNYSLVDQKQFFKKSNKEDIGEILATVNNFDKDCWTYFKDDYENVEFSAEEQPLTHVQVHYGNACQHSSALLVELLPWSLLINTLGCPVAIIVNEKELCRVDHNGILTPPKLDDTFCLGIGIGGTWNVSTPLQLAKSNWSQSFYMPAITGTIPIEGFIKTSINCEPYISVALISSALQNEIRLLKMTSSHVITSHLKIPISVMCFAVPENQRKNPMPEYFESFSLLLPANMGKANSAFPLNQWYHLIKNVDQNVNTALYLSFADDSKSVWSCPLRVDKVIARRSVAVVRQNYSIPIVLVSQEYKGQVFLSVHHDKHPQILVENQSGTKLYCAQFNNESGCVNDCEHFQWVCSVEDGQRSYYSMPFLREKFPEMANVPTTENLVLASDPENDPRGFVWSGPVNVANTNDQFVRVPFYGDVKISVRYSVHTTRICIESVSQVEISAHDIRVRLSLHENESKMNRKELMASDSSSTLMSSYFSAEESFSSASIENLRLERINNPIKERNVATLQDLDDSELPFIRKERKERVHSMRLAVFLKSVIFTLTSDLENSSAEKTEIATISCDNVALTIAKSKISQICFCISAIQVDNQLHCRGSYDFPVIFIPQDLSGSERILNANLNLPISQLINDTLENCLVRIDVNVESWPDPILKKWLTDVKDVNVKIQPIALFIEDTYMIKLKEHLSELIPSNLVIWQAPKPNQEYKISATSVPVPAHITFGASMLAQPIYLQQFTVEDISILLSVHSSVKLYIALDQSPLQFSRFDKRRLFTTYYRLGHAMTMHYLSGAIFGAGWVVGSLELLGSPGGLARSMGTGLRDFVSLPYYGFLKGPWAFLWGVSYGSASLMKHVTAGTLQSITKLASSVARNLDRLTLDEEHLRRTEETRRQRPQGLTQGFVQGLTGFGISLLGAVGGIAHHPLQSVMNDGVSPKALVSGVGRGIVGVFTKPLSGAAELLALTGEGLLQGAGWNVMPEPRMKPVLNHIFSSPNSVVKYQWKFFQSITESNILFVSEATAISNVSHYDAVALVLTTSALAIVDLDEDLPQRTLALARLTGIVSNDPTLLTLKVDPVKTSSTKVVEDDVVLEMDPACRARVVDFVRNTSGLVQIPSESNISPEHSEMSISPDVSPAPSPLGTPFEPTTLTFYVNPQSRNYLLRLLALAKQQLENHNFHIL